MDSFYVYTYASSLDGKVFYVGKGCNDRYMQHCRDARKYYYERYTMRRGERNKRKMTRVAMRVIDIWDKGGKIIIRKPYKNLPDLESLELERSLIVFYGFEQLVNYPYIKSQRAS